MKVNILAVTECRTFELKWLRVNWWRNMQVFSYPLCSHCHLVTMMFSRCHFMWNKIRNILKSNILKLINPLLNRSIVNGLFQRNNLPPLQCCIVVSELLEFRLLLQVYLNLFFDKGSISKNYCNFCYFVAFIQKAYASLLFKACPH